MKERFNTKLFVISALIIAGTAVMVRFSAEDSSTNSTTAQTIEAPTYRPTNLPTNIPITTVGIPRRP